jgi:predicted amidohydrolase YtcJ
MNSLGLTSLSNNVLQDDQREVLTQMAQAGKIPLRIYDWPVLSDGIEHAMALRERHARSENLRIGGLKTWMDRVESSYTGWLLEPYADALDKSGFPCVDINIYKQQAIQADQLGFQLITHAIGDKAIRTTLDIYEEVGRTNGARDRRFRVEHCEVIHPDDQARFARLNVIASTTPLHCTADVERYLKYRLGEGRAERFYPWRKLVDLGVHLAFGTDWPAVELKAPNPLEQIYGAVTRTHPAVPSPAWHPEMCLSVPEAVRSCTLEPAYAEFAEDRKGSITPGKLADLIVLSDDIFQPPAERILQTRVLITVFNGRIVFNQLT